MAIVGVSGSPFVDGNTDRMVKALLEQTGKDHIFLNLSTLKYDPCRACAHLCAKTNLCPVDDDLKPYFKPVLDAEALVLGTPTHSGHMSAWMFSFLSRLWCLYHMKKHLRNKPVVLVVTALHSKSEDIMIPRLKECMRNYNILGHVFYASNIPPCYTCGLGKVCKVGALWRVLGEDEEKLKNFRLTLDMFKRWENCPQTIAEIQKYAKVLSQIKTVDTTTF